MRLACGSIPLISAVNVELISDQGTCRIILLVFSSYSLTKFVSVHFKYVSF